jgi:predicted ABC-type ATPase
MTDRPPLIVLLGGCNGAGKSTTAPALLQGPLAVSEFVNADVIARGLSAFHPERTAIDAGRIMLDRLHELAARQVSFAFESTLASRSFVPWIAQLCATGYEFGLLFLWLSNPEHAVARVAERVRLGGHDVPEETIRRRYFGGLRNFFELYQPLANMWRFYENSQPFDPRLIASGCGRIVETIADLQVWKDVQRIATRK